MFKKFTPKNVKLCPGCPPKEIKPVTMPKFTMKLPDMNDTKVTSLKNDNPDANARVRKGKNTVLF